MSPARQFGRPRGPIVKSARVREIKLGTHANGDRFALFRHEGTRSSYWHSLPISLAERAIAKGRLVFAGFDTPAKAYEPKDVQE